MDEHQAMYTPLCFVGPKQYGYETHIGNSKQETLIPFLKKNSQFFSAITNTLFSAGFL